MPSCSLSAQLVAVCMIVATLLRCSVANAIPARGELSRLRGLLDAMKRWASGRTSEGRQTQRKLKQLNDGKLTALAQSPEGLLLLLRYQRQIDASIDRRIAQLRR